MNREKELIACTKVSIWGRLNGDTSEDTACDGALQMSHSQRQFFARQQNKFLWLTFIQVLDSKVRQRRIPLKLLLIHSQPCTSHHRAQSTVQCAHPLLSNPQKILLFTRMRLSHQVQPIHTPEPAYHIVNNGRIEVAEHTWKRLPFQRQNHRMGQSSVGRDETGCCTDILPKNHAGAFSGNLQVHLVQEAEQCE